MSRDRRRRGEVRDSGHHLKLDRPVSVVQLPFSLLPLYLNFGGRVHDLIST